MRGREIEVKVVTPPTSVHHLGLRQPPAPARAAAPAEQQLQLEQQFQLKQQFQLEQQFQLQQQRFRDVPEPGTLTLFGAAILGGLFFYRRRQIRAG
jgi:hypothetical protein